MQRVDWLVASVGAVLHINPTHIIFKQIMSGRLIIFRLHTWAGMNGTQFVELTQACKFAYIPVFSEAIQICIYIHMCEHAYKWNSAHFFLEETVFSKELWRSTFLSCCILRI